MTRLTDAIIEAYSYDADDIKALAAKLTERRRAGWINELSALAQTHGCGQRAGTPKGADARELRQMSQTDAESIARTFNRDMTRTVERLNKSNPRGNRRYYTSNLDKWARARDSWKSLQIGLNTDSTVRQFAQQRFYEMNPQLAQRFAAFGVPPVCKICIRIFAAGVVDFSYTQRNPLPAHIFCPHLYQPVAPAKAECAKLWLG
jgi:hypothetical protein